jgi:hypothetical protein
MSGFSFTVPLKFLFASYQNIDYELSNRILFYSCYYRNINDQNRSSEYYRTIGYRFQNAYYWIIR